MSANQFGHEVTHPLFSATFGGSMSVANNQLFWTENDDLHCADLALFGFVLTNPRVLDSGGWGVANIAVEGADLYFAKLYQGHYSLFKARPQSGQLSSERLNSGGFDGCIAVENGVLYYANKHDGVHSDLRRYNLPDLTAPHLINAGGWDVPFAVGNETIFWTKNGNLYRNALANFELPAPVGGVIMDNGGYAGPLAVANGHLFFTYNGRLRTVPI